MNVSSALRIAVPVLVVTAGALGLEVAYDVALGDALLYLAYELCFVVIPGWLAYRALSDRPGGALRQLAMGWALGYVLEILAFMLTAATGTRDLFVAYPVLVGAAAAFAIVRRPAAEASTPADAAQPARFRWALVAVCVAAVAYMAVAYFPAAPLPGSKDVSYFQDYPWTVSIAADAKHHWPIEDPNVSGEPFPYHYFLHIHLAAASQVTGLDVPLVFLRLFILPLVVLLVLELVVAGQSFSHSVYAGLIAACLALFIGELQLDARENPLLQAPFQGVFFFFLFLSPTFLFGLVMLVPLITVLGERLSGPDRVARTPEWLLVVLFLVGASDAKAALLPLVLGALLLYAGWAWLVERRIPLAVWLAAVLTLLVSGTVYFFQYRGWPSGLRVDLLAGYHFFSAMPAVSSVKSGLRGVLPGFPGREAVLGTGGIVFGILGLLAAQLVGLAWMFRHHGIRLRAGQAWLCTVLAAGLVSLLVLGSARGESQFFFFSSLVAGCLLSAEGLRIAWIRRPNLSGQGKRLALLALGCALAIAALMLAPKHLHLFPGPHRNPDTYLFWYVGFALTLALFYATARRWFGATHWPAVALVCGAVLAVGALDTPISRLVPDLTNPPQAPAVGHQITPQLYGALTWIRDRTPGESVVAINDATPFALDYSAFAERRVFLGGWGYSASLRDTEPKELARTDPFPDRLRLNRAAFTRGDVRALETMRARYGVRYLVVDRVNGPPADLHALVRAGRLVYTAPGVAVIELS
jgi:hypothetical protein